MHRINIDSRKLKGAAPVVLPIVALYLLKVTSVPAPTLAAAHLDETPALGPVRLVQPDDESLRCAAWAREQQGAPVDTSPFFYPESETLVIDPNPVEVESGPALEPIATLEGVMGSGKRLMALINGNLLSVGDTVDGDWKILSINVDSRAVDLVHADGRTFRLESAH